MTFETFDQSDQKTWPDPKPTYLPTYLHTYLITHWATFDSQYVAGFFLATGSRIFSCYRCDIVCGNARSQLRRKTILQTCDIWDTVCNSNNWEPEFLTTFVTWQLRVTVDSIRNSCDVFCMLCTFLLWRRMWIAGHQMFACVQISRQAATKRWEYLGLRLTKPMPITSYAFNKTLLRALFARLAVISRHP